MRDALVSNLPEMNAESGDDEEQRHTGHGEPHDVEAQLLEPLAPDRPIRGGDHRVAQHDGQCGQSSEKVDGPKPHRWRA